MRCRAFPLLILLAGCTPMVKPLAPPRVVTVVVNKPVPVDPRLVRHCPIALPNDRSVSEVLRVARSRAASLVQCNHQLDEIGLTH